MIDLPKGCDVLAIFGILLGQQCTSVGYDNARCSQSPSCWEGADQLRNADETYAVMLIVIGQKAYLVIW